MNGYQRLRAFDDASRLRDATANIRAALEAVELASSWVPAETVWLDRCAVLRRELAVLVVRTVEQWLELSKVFDAHEREAASEEEEGRDESSPF